MSRGQLRRLQQLEAQGRTHRGAAQTRWGDTLWELADAGKVEGEEVVGMFRLLDRYQMGDRSPAAVAAWARWEALLEENPELRRRTSLLSVWHWWETWADVWQRA